MNRKTHNAKSAYIKAYIERHSKKCKLAKEINNANI
jgi:hypothetical protein